MKRITFATLLALLCFAAPASASVLWTGDATSPLDQQWAEVSDQAHCAQVLTPGVLPDANISTEADATAPHGVRIHFHMNAGDRSCYLGRAELGQALPSRAGAPVFAQGDDRWVAMEFYLPSTFPLNDPSVSRGSLIMQFKQVTPCGPYPILTMSAKQGQLVMAHSPDSSCSNGGSTVDVPIAPVTQGQWYQLSLHILFSTTGGSADVYLNGAQVYHYSGATLKVSGPSHSRLGLYPDTQRSGTPAMDLYMAGYTVATDRASAEANAFAGSGPPPPPPPNPPTAAFTYSPSAPQTGQLVTFDGSASTCPDTCTYAWTDDQSKGSLGTGQILPFTFHYVGTKFVRLTVTDAEGQTATVEQNVNVTSGPPPPPPTLPTASFTVAPASPTTGQVVTFDGSASTCPDLCSYVYSDDNVAGSILGNHPVSVFTFHYTGTKKVRLTVTDAGGHVATVEHDVTVR